MPDNRLQETKVKLRFGCKLMPCITEHINQHFVIIHPTQHTACVYIVIYTRIK